MNSIKKQYDMLLKVVFVGDSGVGKTSLLRMETEKQFTEQHLATIGVDFKIKAYKVEGINVKVQLWDTAGQERFRSIQKPYYKNSHAICLCFNLNDRQSFDNLTFWLNELKNFDVTGQVYLIGCKSDLDNMIPTDEILSFASSYQVNYAQTSAKENVGIQECFERIISEATKSNLIKMAFNQPLQRQKRQIELQQNSINNMIKKKTCC